MEFLLSAKIIEKTNAVEFLGETGDDRLSLNEHVRELVKIKSISIQFQLLYHLTFNSVPITL